MKDRELKDREVKIKREIDKKIKSIKKSWYSWLINYIREPIRKSVGPFKDKIVSPFKTNTPKQTMHGRGKKLSKPKTKNIRNRFILKKKKKKLKIE